MPSSPPYFAFYPADFANDHKVEAMTTAQVGAYILLLCKAWQADPPGSLPNDDQTLARYARMSAVEWAESKAAVLNPFTFGKDGRLHQQRLRREYDIAAKRVKDAKNAASVRWMRGHYGGISEGNASPSNSSSDSSSPDRGGGAGEGPTFADRVMAGLGLPLDADKAAAVRQWAEFHGLTFGWFYDSDAARLASWLGGWLRNSVTVDELTAATTELSQRTERIKSRDEMRSAMNAALKRGRKKLAAVAVTAPSQAPDIDPDVMAEIRKRGSGRRKPVSP
jgi:uncharacterized protein YdaU (DUF1376 family)